MFSPCTLRKFLTQTLLFSLLADSSFLLVLKAKRRMWSVHRSRDAGRCLSGPFAATQFSLQLQQSVGSAVVSCETRMPLGKHLLEVCCIVSVRSSCWPCSPLITSRLPAQMEVGPHGGTPQAPGEESTFVALPLHWLSACSNARTWRNGELALLDREDHKAASVDVSLQLPCPGHRINKNFASKRALKLPDVAQR